MPNVNRWLPPQRNGKKQSLRFINKNAKNLPYGWVNPRSKKTRSKKTRSKKRIYYTKINRDLNRDLNKILNRHLKKIKN